MSKVVQSLLSDNSLQKELTRRHLLTRRRAFLSQEVRICRNRQTKIKMVQDRIRELQGVRSYLHDSFLSLEKSMETEVSAAKLIQQFVRKKQVCQRTQETALPKIKKAVNSQLTYNLKYFKMLRLNIGDKLLHSTIYIQRAYRRHRFYKKIMRICLLYTSDAADE